ncbi:MAG TPA: type II secretion system F family protein [Vicinamibacterales bacterium]|nr:type II secretion system F family protein [Vicinamibacterales bacterium]
MRRDLEEKGLFVLSLQPRSWVPGWSASTPRRRVSRQEFLVFNQELATLLKAGMPLVQSLEILRQRVANPMFKTVLDGVHEKVRSGTALSDAFAEHGDLFPAVYTASLMAGERSGNLDSVIRRYVAYEKLIGAARRRTISALIYPAILMAMMTILVGVIVVLVIPKFSDFYANFDRPLPLLTRVIVGFSNALVGNIWIIVPVSVGLVIAAVFWSRQPSQRALLDKWILLVPWAGETARKFFTAQLARMLSTLLSGGIPLVNAIEIGVRSTSNRYMSDALDEVRRRVQEGQSFSAALRARSVFPDVAVKMVEVGESTGALQEMLNSLAEFYDEEIETEVERVTKMIEPVMLVIMGIVIAAVVLALYMPLFELASVVGT